MTEPAELTVVLSTTDTLLLDFDGPMCAVFAALPAPEVADELRRVLHHERVSVPDDIDSEADPLMVLAWVGTLARPALTRRVDDELRRAELRAIEGATPTPYARETIVAAQEAGRSVAIVSNNSEPAIRAYLDAHRLSRYVRPIIGRSYGRPELMKPDPTPISKAVAGLGGEPGQAVLVGDSVTDIQGARRAGVRSIGYANKPGKRGRLLTAGADVVVEGRDGMRDIAAALLDSLPN